jgi:sigma-B regulation protein RsbU (phosphoserine phosphatase)
LETFERVHAKAPHQPIIVLSGLDDARLAIRAVQRGAQDYLVKGHVDSHVLVRAMRYAIERKRMGDQLAEQADALRRKNEQMEADLKMAREIQQLFVPQAELHFPPAAALEHSALRFCHRYLPAAALSGDFFTIFPVTETQAGVFICDVMGHGVRAALITAMMRALVEDLKAAAPEAGEFMTQINRGLHALLRRTDEPVLATAFYLLLDVASGELSFASAGHPSPLRVDRKAKTVEPLSAYDRRHGPALGLFEKSVYPVGRCLVAVNDLIVLFTDGLYEVEGPGHEEFGVDRLLAAIRSRSGLPALRLFDEVLSEIRQFAAGREFQDDVCMVGMEIAQLGR